MPSFVLGFWMWENALRGRLLLQHTCDLPFVWLAERLQNSVDPFCDCFHGLLLGNLWFHPTLPPRAWLVPWQTCAVVEWTDLPPPPFPYIGHSTACVRTFPCLVSWVQGGGGPTSPVQTDSLALVEIIPPHSEKGWCMYFPKCCIFEFGFVVLSTSDCAGIKCVM